MSIFGTDNAGPLGGLKSLIERAKKKISPKENTSKVLKGMTIFFWPCKNEDHIPPNHYHDEGFDYCVLGPQWHKTEEEAHECMKQ